MRRQHIIIASASAFFATMAYADRPDPARTSEKPRDIVFELPANLEGVRVDSIHEALSEAVSKEGRANPVAIQTDLAEDWLSDPGWAGEMEATLLAYHDGVLALPMGETPLWTMKEASDDSGDVTTRTFRMYRGDGDLIVQFTRTPDGGFETSMVAEVPWVDGAARPPKMRVIDGRIQVEQIRREWEASVESDVPTAGGTASGGGCAAASNGAVCCSFQMQAKVRVVCMCPQPVPSSSVPNYVTCGDTHWMAE